ncbi:palmitoyltransferase for Vac8p [Zygosaccharomyces mellis]|uniref:Palmitoyltransferase n=1 Tax=Zygosaccharomyces mellis TaxID=42258 RepID=A0A4C2E6N0_9SACH|nr:palmitoyltransferase for Vac8p [Zygosaccharomyces mellis]
MSRPKVPLSRIFPRCLTISLYLWSSYVSLTRIHLIWYKFLVSVDVILVMIGLYTYRKVIVTGPGSPLDYEMIRISDMRAVESGSELPPEFLSRRSITMKRDGRFRVCRTCHVWKPDRCHHCSRCDKCILKMDHHCPWFPSCIGFNNQRFFIQFLLYATTYSTITFLFSTIQLFDWFRKKQYEVDLIDFHLLSVWLLSIAVSVSLPFFTGFTIYQVTKNQTTIEMHIHRRYREELEILADTCGSINSSRDNAYDLGSALANWKDLMGEYWVEWFFPVNTSKMERNRNTLDHKGLYFELRGDINGRLLETMNLQDRLLRRLTPRSSIDQMN